MIAEYALASRVVRTHDFNEGVRALLIDKDNDAPMGPGDARGGYATRCSTPFSHRCPGREAWTPFPGDRRMS